MHDVREPLPNASVDGVFAHMRLCMALSTREIHAEVGEVRRVLRPGGVFVYTVCYAGDAHHDTGIAHGEDIFEQAGGLRGAIFHSDNSPNTPRRSSPRSARTSA